MFVIRRNAGRRLWLGVKQVMDKLAQAVYGFGTGFSDC